jgi:hypothetical protein
LTKPPRTRISASSETGRREGLSAWGLKLAEQADAPSGEIDEHTLDLGADLDGAEHHDGEDLDPEDPPEGGEGDEAGVDITIEGEEATPASPEEQGTELVRHLRAEIRKRDQIIAGKAAPTQVEQPIEVGVRPTMESCEYDEERFEKELDAWKDREAAAKAQAKAVEERTQASNAAWLEELKGHAAKAKALKLPGYEAAEALAVAGLNQIQQAIVVKAADDSAKVIYALGRFPKKLAELSAIEDPIKFAKAIINLEKDLKVTPRRTAADPDEIPRGDAPLSRSSDKELERLEREADRTGDRTKVQAYQRRLRDTAKPK